MRIVVLAVLCAFAAGCYSNRRMSVYDSIPELSGENEEDAILAESGNDPETLARNERRLRELEGGVEPAYKMNAGDQIEIRVYDHPDLCVSTRIGPDGMVGLAFMGQVSLVGKTIAEGAESIRKGLAPYVKNPNVTIVLVGVHGETATIAGSCAKPGVYGISNTTRLADLYAMAGASANRYFNGVNVDVADLEHSIFVRDGEVLPIDFIKAIDLGDKLHNVRVRKGDYVFIAQRMESSVVICGDVATPHKRLFESGMGLVETLAVAGWMKETHWSHVILIRNGLSNPKMYKVDVDGILAGRCRNVHLKAGDIVYVPHDSMSEYNVFVRKLLPTAQLIGLIASPFSSINIVD